MNIYFYLPTLMYLSMLLLSPHPLLCMSIESYDSDSSRSDQEGGFNNGIKRTLQIMSLHTRGKDSILNYNTPITTVYPPSEKELVTYHKTIDPFIFDAKTRCDRDIDRCETSYEAFVDFAEELWGTLPEDNPTLMNASKQFTLNVRNIRAEFICKQAVYAEFVTCNYKNIKKIEDAAKILTQNNIDNTLITPFKSNPEIAISPGQLGVNIKIAYDTFLTPYSSQLTLTWSALEQAALQKKRLMKQNKSSTSFLDISNTGRGIRK